MAITGRAVLLLALGSFLILFRPELPSLLWWLLGTALLVLLDVLLAPSPKALVLEREASTPVRLNERGDSALLVTNQGRRRLRGILRDAWQPSAGAHPNRFPLDLPAGERRRFAIPLLPVRRGVRRTDRVTVRSRGPLGLAARQRSLEAPGQLVTLPAFPSRKHLPAKLAKLQQIEGGAVARNRGQGTEFDSLREYVDGDDVRSIDWRASGRRNHVIVKTWRPERERKVLIVLDTSRLSAGRVGDVPRLDSGMDAALLLSALCAKAEDKVELIAGDRVVRSQVRTTRRGNTLMAFSHAMAELEPALVEADWTELGGAIATLGRQSLVVLVTPMEPAALEETLLPVLYQLAARQRIVIASVGDRAVDEIAALRDDERAVHAAAAAEEVRLRKAHLVRVLAQLGVTVIEASPDDLPVALADHYLLLKSRGLL